VVPALTAFCSLIAPLAGCTTATVHARVSTYEGDVDRLIDGFQRQADLVRRLDGFARAFLLVDRAGGRAMTVTLWDSEGARDASAARAAHLREEATETAGATIGSVDGYELAFEIEPG
jgi:heme-degrading monooxygenase HmoA